MKDVAVTSTQNAVGWLTASLMPVSPASPLRVMGIVLIGLGTTVMDVVVGGIGILVLVEIGNKDWKDTGLRNGIFL